MIEFILFCLGLVILIKGANFLVDGASSLAVRFSIAPIVIGLTVVSFGTSAPELVVSLFSAIKGNTDIALGNVIGSNIANILLILGITAIIYPLSVLKNTVWKEIPFSFLAAILVVILAIQFPIDINFFGGQFISSKQVVGEINRIGGFVLLVFFAFFLYYSFGITKVNANTDLSIKSTSLSKSVFFIAVGLAALALGSRIAVDNAVTLARLLGISDVLIGLTLIAVGTSLPELFTSITAALKKNSDIALGNIVGSNIFNILFVLGSTALVKEIPIKGAQTVDILVLWLATLLLFVSIFVWKRHSIGRKEGIIMVACYIGYLLFLVNRG
jgi:cation:H+ antiporter